MVLTLDAEALAALDQSRDGCQIIATAFYGQDQVIPGSGYPSFPDGVPITTDGSLSFDSTAQVQATGTVSVSRDGGSSLVPATQKDPLAPYGQELGLAYRIVAGGITTDVPLGRYRITDVPDAQTYFQRHPGVQNVVGWATQLTLKDRFDILDGDSFLTATSPSQYTSTRAEVQLLASQSGLVVVWPDTIADAAIPSSLVYQSGRLDAITQLMTNVTCNPAMTRQGSLTLYPQNAWLTATNDDAVFTVNGTIDPISDGMSNDLFNSVRVTNQTDTTILGVAEITDPSNPLCVTGPLGRRSYTNANPLATTQDTANAMAATILARVSTQQSKTIQVSCLPRPDIELGDVGIVTDDLSGRSVLGQVTAMTLQMDATAAMSLTLQVGA